MVSGSKVGGEGQTKRVVGLRSKGRMRPPNLRDRAAEIEIERRR